MKYYFILAFVYEQFELNEIKEMYIDGFYIQQNYEVLDSSLKDRGFKFLLIMGLIS
jgi:hypothetical protein